MPDESRTDISEITALKKRIRKEIREKRTALLSEGRYFRAAGERITAHILASPQYAAARSVFIYVSMPGEPDTYALIEAALRDGKAVYVPKCLTKDTMAAVRIRSLDELKPGRMGIPEPDLPETGVLYGCAGLDLILVPCVSVSPDKIRLGHGAGYYDRFLDGCISVGASADAPETAADPVRIKKDGPFHRPVTFCLCYEELTRDDIPAGPHDIPMDHIVTENGIF